MANTLIATVQDVTGRATEFASLYVPPWAASTAYIVGAVVVSGQNQYTCTAGGVSSTTGPTGFGTGIVDNAAVWAFVALDPITVALNDANLQVNTIACGSRAQLAQTYLAAHLLSCRYPALANPAGPTNHDQVGGVLSRYAVSASPATAADFSTSRWGQAFRTLMRQIPTVFVSGGLGLVSNPYNPVDVANLGWPIN